MAYSYCLRSVTIALRPVHHEMRGSQRCALFHSNMTKRDLVQTQGLINGEWMHAQNKQQFSVHDPSTEKEIARVANMGKHDTLLAIETASNALKTWKKTTPHQRSRVLKMWHEAIRTHSNDLAQITSAETGKPYSEAKGEVAYAASFVDFYAHECMTSGGSVIPITLPDQQLLSVKQPVGVCGIITPWNFPLAMITRKLAPLLAAGCTAVVKPAAETPLSALALAKLAQEVGIPRGVINIITSSVDRAAEVGETLATHPDVRKLSFTGSTRVGKLLMAQSAAQLKRLSLELGGNAPFIVFEDADLSAAVSGLMTSKFRNAGQACVATNRVFLHSSIANAFTKELVKQVKQLKIGSPHVPDVNIGPLISQNAFQKVHALVQDAVEKGAQVLCGGKPASLVGANFYEPTVLVNVTQDMHVANEEIFGPIISIVTFTDEEEVLALANGTESGLAGYFYSCDLSRVHRVAAALEVGMVGINAGSVSYAQAPFGGVKQSGLGREGSSEGLQEYLETKFICMGGLD